MTFGRIAEALPQAIGCVSWQKLAKSFFLMSLLDCCNGYVLHVEVTVRQPALDLHGLLGQSLGQLDNPCSDNFDFTGEGNESEYVMAALSDVHFKYSNFGKILSRSLARKILAANFVPLVAKLG